MMKSLLSSDDGQAASSESIESFLSDGSSAAVIGEPSSCCSPATLVRSRYCTTAFCGSYPWSLTTSLTCRWQTPPLAFCSFQYSWVACTIGLASGAKTPDRSVSRPSVISLSVTPGPVLIEPAEPPPDEPPDSSPLLPQPATTPPSRAATASAPARDRRVGLMGCSPWVAGTCVRRGAGVAGGGARRPVRPARR